MPKLLAIELSSDTATCVSASVDKSGPIQIQDIFTAERKIVETTAAEESEGEEIEAQEESFDFIAPETFQPLEFQSVSAVLNQSKIIYTNSKLPFNDPRKLEKIVPAELRDSSPFREEGFLGDSIVLEQEKDGRYDILGCFALEEAVVEAINASHALGVDPEEIGSKGLALFSLAKFYFSDSDEKIAILDASSSHWALIVIQKEKLLHVREFSIGTTEELSKETLGARLEQIRCSLLATERQQNSKINQLYILGSQEIREQASRELDRPNAVWDLSNVVENHTAQDISIAKYAWALGLFVEELEGSKTSKARANFRIGKHAFGNFFASLKEAFKDEVIVILLGISFPIAWLLLSLYIAHSKVTVADEAITAETRNLEVSSPLVKRREVESLEGMVEELEEQLRSVGSLSSLSPLESLSELSKAIGAQIDIETNSLNIGFSRIVLRGSVPDNPALGRLESALKTNKRFCEVTVNPNGRDSRSSRVKFSAEIKVCE